MTSPTSFFETGVYIPPDPIFELTKKYLADENPDKVNLGQGTYRDSKGQPWVLSSVQGAKELLKDCGHEYLQIAGFKPFRDLASDLAFHGLSAQTEDRIAHIQALSGTGSLYIAGLAMKMLNPVFRRVYITSPTWSPHDTIFATLGFEVVNVPYYDATTRSFDFPAYIAMLRDAPRGSVVILHTCAHNPTGCDPSPEQWREIGSVIKTNELFPIFDSAYLGFNSGDVDTDAWAIRYFVEDLGLEAAVCLSFAKNMGLYGERIGLVAFVARTRGYKDVVQSILERCQRVTVSNPPRWGAEIVAKVLGDEKLKAVWQQDLKTMSGRIKEMRKQLYAGLVELGEYPLSFLTHACHYILCFRKKYDHLTRPGRYRYAGRLVAYCKADGNVRLHGIEPSSDRIFARLVGGFLVWSCCSNETTNTCYPNRESPYLHGRLVPDFYRWVK